MKSDYKRVKRKIMLRVFLIGIAVVAVAILLLYILVDGVLQDPFARGFVRFAMGILGISEYSAVELYRFLFVSFKWFWLGCGFLILAIIAFRIALRPIFKYLTEIQSGVDGLLDGTNTMIRLSSELSGLEHQLNTAKDELRRRSENAASAEQRKNDMVVYLAHDIKTPLTSVIGYLTLLNELPDMPAEQRAKYVGITLDKAYRLEKLIDEFFDITRFNLQYIPIEKRELDLSYMLAQMAEEFTPMLIQGGKSVSLNMPETLTIMADADKLARVFNNILKNAAAYSAQGTTIDVSARENGGNVFVAVKNSGTTIPRDKLNTIFEKFFRLDSARSGESGGAGLGLAIAKEIVEAHGGSISATSEDGETTFFVRLPAN